MGTLSCCVRAGPAGHCTEQTSAFLPILAVVQQQISCLRRTGCSPVQGGSSFGMSILPGLWGGQIAGSSLANLGRSLCLCHDEMEEIFTCCACSARMPGCFRAGPGPGVNPVHLKALLLCHEGLLGTNGGSLGTENIGESDSGSTCEHLVLCVPLCPALWSTAHCVSKGKKCPEIPQTLQCRFCSAVRQKSSLCAKAERNSPIPQRSQSLNVNYLPPCACTSTSILLPVHSGCSQLGVLGHAGNMGRRLGGCSACWLEQLCFLVLIFH